MNDKPEAVAWMYTHHGSMVTVSAVRYEAAVTKALGYIETPLYPEPITLHESQVRWRQAFDEMHQRAMKAEAALATPAQPDASALVEALRAVKEAYGESESARIDAALMFEIADNALTAWEAQHG